MREARLRREKREFIGMLNDLVQVMMSYLNFRNGFLAFRTVKDVIVNFE